MSLDFQQVREQVQKLGEAAPARQRELQAKRDISTELLASQAGEIDEHAMRPAR